jgi:transcriptional regulator with PAS, ATPase and Fis domain
MACCSTPTGPSRKWRFATVPQCSGGISSVSDSSTPKNSYDRHDFSGTGEPLDGKLISFNPSPDEKRLMLLSAVTMEANAEQCILMMMMDITEQHQLQASNQELEALIRSREDALGALDEALRSKQRLLEQTEKQLALIGAVFNHVGEAVFITDPNGNILSVNPAFTRIMGYREEEVLGKNPRIFKSDRHDREFYAKMGTR